MANRFSYITKIAGYFISIHLGLFSAESNRFSVYYGKWKGVVCNTALFLALSKKSVVVEMKGGEKVQDVKYEYVYSNISSSPFLSVMFTDNNKIEYLLYVAIGSGSEDKKGQLTGFYEKSKLIEDSHGRLETSSEGVGLIRPGD